jgi:hypothetical protein
VTIIETHASVHPTALPLVDLATAGRAFRYVRCVRAGDDDFTFHLNFTHFFLDYPPTSLASLKLPTYHFGL